MKEFKTQEIWFLTGSQKLYGEQTLMQVEKDSKAIARGLSDSSSIPVPVVFKPVLTDPEGIFDICLEANRAKNCAGLITWMHTFSPAKMWIAGLKALQKPLLHLHTQFNRDIPWESIDMDFMNLNQSAHGGREYGFMVSRLRLNRKVVVGYWKDPEVQERVAVWARAACAWHDGQGARIARFGDNMREVAVTEGDKVEAQIRFGYAVHGYALGDLAAAVERVPEEEVDKLLAEYDESYRVADELAPKGRNRPHLRESARIELGLRSFLEEGGFKAFTTCFENLYGLTQLPGLAVQRLMADGYGFGAEGDWKTAALVRAMKIMGRGLGGGTSFMEDYTYHLREGAMKVLGAHMLEVCASLAGGGRPSLEMHPLSIGNKEDPARLVFDVPAGRALNATIVDMGNRFRMLVNEVQVVPPEAPLPKLPVARALWAPHPDLKTAAAAWILGGGAHHAAFSQAVNTEHLEDFAEMAGIEFLLIDGSTTIRELKKELRWNELYYGLARGL
jgi:L-arabinose isomerase